MLYKGRVVTGAGHKILDEVAHAVLPQALEAYPGLDKY
jgi:ribosomal protein S19E (S16A)